MSTLVSRGPNKWLIGIDHAKDPATGKRVRRWHTFHGGKREAQKEQTRLEAEAEAGLAIAPNKMSVEACLKHWLGAVRMQVSAKTHESYGELATAITRQLGAVPLDQLKPAQIVAAWERALSSGRKDGRPLAPRTVRHMHKVLKAALNWAVDMELLSRSPATKVKAPLVPKKTVATYAVPDTARLIGLLREAEIYIPTFLAVMTGARRGEICALRWSDLDLNAGALTISRAIEQLKTSVAVKAPKSGRGRTVALGAAVVDVLREHKRDQAAMLTGLGLRQDPDTPVCTRSDGSMIRPRWLSQRWGILVRASDLPARGFHALRHAHATTLLQSGVHPKVASERLGHSSVAITLDLYSHVLPGMQEDAAAKVDAAYAALSAPPEPK